MRSVKFHNGVVISTKKPRKSNANNAEIDAPKQRLYKPNLEMRGKNKESVKPALRLKKDVTLKPNTAKSEYDTLPVERIEIKTLPNSNTTNNRVDKKVYTNNRHGITVIVKDTKDTKDNKENTNFQFHKYQDILSDDKKTNDNNVKTSKLNKDVYSEKYPVVAVEKNVPPPPNVPDIPKKRIIYTISKSNVNYQKTQKHKIAKLKRKIRQMNFQALIAAEESRQKAASENRKLLRQKLDKCNEEIRKMNSKKSRRPLPLHCRVQKKLAKIDEDIRMMDSMRKPPGPKFWKSRGLITSIANDDVGSEVFRK